MRFLRFIEGPDILNAPPPSIEVSRFLKDGVFVPAAFFEPPLLAFVPPGAQPAALTAPTALGWGLTLCFAGAAAAVAWSVPLPSSRSLAYAAVAMAPLAFATSTAYSAANVYLVLAVAFFLTGFLADRGSPWYLAWAVVLGAAPLVFVDVCAAVVFACSAKVLLDAAVLNGEPSAQERYGLWRRWGSAGTAVMTMCYGLSTHLWPQSPGLYSLIASAVAVLLVGACRFPALPVRFAPECGVRAWADGSAAVVAILLLGFGRGALLPHAFALQLVDEGLPSQAAGLVGVIALAVEFAVLSMGGCLGSAHSLLATGMVLSGTNLQVVCALSGKNWLFILPLSAALHGASTGLVAMAVPRIASGFGGPMAQGAFQGLELFGTALAVEIWPYLAEVGGVTFAYQLAADLLIVVGVLALLTSQGPKVILGLSRQNSPEVSRSTPLDKPLQPGP